MIEDKAIKTIKNKYYLQDINSLSILKVTLPENERKLFYAVFKKEGVTIYDYTEDNELIEFGALKWSDFPYVTIRNLKTKNTISFIAEDRFRRMTIIEGDSEEIKNFLKEHTPAQVNTTGIRWYNKVPGFRSETRWKMIVSAIVYMWVLAAIYNTVL